MQESEGQTQKNNLWPNGTQWLVNSPTITKIIRKQWYDCAYAQRKLNWTATITIIIWVKNKWRVVIHSIEIKRKFIRWNEADEGKSKKKPQQKADAQFCA